VIGADVVDARILAHLPRTGLLPESYAPFPEVRRLRELLRHRAALVQMETGLKNRIRAVLARRNIRLHHRTLISQGAQRELEALQLPIETRKQLDQCIGLLLELRERVNELDRDIRQRAHLSPEAAIFMTAPGIGQYRALLILAEVGDIRRFPSARKLASYAGLVRRPAARRTHTPRSNR
jgi:transposase